MVAVAVLQEWYVYKKLRHSKRVVKIQHYIQKERTEGFSLQHLVLWPSNERIFKNQRETAQLCLKPKIA